MPWVSSGDGACVGGGGRPDQYPNRSLFLTPLSEAILLRPIWVGASALRPSAFRSLKSLLNELTSPKIRT